MQGWEGGLGGGREGGREGEREIGERWEEGCAGGRWGGDGEETYPHELRRRIMRRLHEESFTLLQHSCVCTMSTEGRQIFSCSNFSKKFSVRSQSKLPTSTFRKSTADL